MFPNFENIWRIIYTIALQLAQKWARKKWARIFFSSKLRSRKSVRFSEEIISVDKYPCIFSCQMMWRLLLKYFLERERQGGTFQERLLGLRSANWDPYFWYIKLYPQVQTLTRIQKYTSQAKTQRAGLPLANQVLSIGLGKGFKLTELLLLRQLACSLYKPRGNLCIIMGVLVRNFEKIPPLKGTNIY